MRHAASVTYNYYNKIAFGKWGELEELDKKYNAVDELIGFPPKKRYQSLAGEHVLPPARGRNP